MKEEFIKALDKVTNHFLEMSDQEFSDMLVKHKDEPFAKTLRELNYVGLKNSYYFDDSSLLDKETKLGLTTKSISSRYKLKTTTPISISKSSSIIVGEEKWQSQSA